MFESIAIAVFLLLGVVLVYLKSRARLGTPGARRSRDTGGERGDRSGERPGGDGDGGDGGD